MKSNLLEPCNDIISTTDWWAGPTTTATWCSICCQCWRTLWWYHIHCAVWTGITTTDTSTTYAYRTTITSTQTYQLLIRDNIKKSNNHRRNYMDVSCWIWVKEKVLTVCVQHEARVWGHSVCRAVVILFCCLVSLTCMYTQSVWGNTFTFSAHFMQCCFYLLCYSNQLVSTEMSYNSLLFINLCACCGGAKERHMRNNVS